jgi:outer membrane protein assembly factor BamB
MAVIAIVISLLRNSGSAQDPSATFHHDNQRTGRTFNIGPSVPRLRWSVRTGSSIEASPVISPDGTIYVASTDGYLYAFSNRGLLKWAFAAKESIYATPAVGPDGTVFFADLAGWYYAVHPDGTPKWAQALAGGALERRVISPPVVADSGQSYVAAWNDCLYAFGADGKLLWEYAFEGEGQISAAPVLDAAGNVFVATHDPGNKNRIAVFKFAPDSPTVLWKFSDDLGVDRNRIISSPAVDAARNRLYVGAAREYDGCLYAINTADGRPAYLTGFPKGIVSSPAIARDGSVYIGCLDGNVYALDPDTGNYRWTFFTGAEFVMGSPTIDGTDVIYVGDSDGVLHSLSRTGQELWRYALKSNIVSAPAIADDGTLYITSYDSTLYAVGERSKRRAPR